MLQATDIELEKLCKGDRKRAGFVSSQITNVLMFT